MSAVNEQPWFHQWSYKVIRDIEQCTDWGAKSIALVAIKGTMENYITMQEYPLLLQRLQQGMEKKKIKANWSHIEERRIDVTKLSAVAKSDAQGDSYVVIASCPSQLMDEVKATVKGNRNVMASWATAGDISSLDESVATISLESVNTPTVTTSAPSWLFEGGADGAIENFKRVFGKAPEDFVDGSNDWDLASSKCITIEKQNAVARMLATNATVKGWSGRLSLNDNNIGAERAKFICEAVKHSKTLDRLFLTDNKIGDEGAKFIGEAVKHSKTLERLFLSNNNIGDEGAKFIGEGVKHSKSLKLLTLRDNQFTDAAKVQLTQVGKAQHILLLV